GIEPAVVAPVEDLDQVVLAGLAQLGAGQRRAVRRGVEDRGQVRDQLALPGRQRRRHVLGGPVQDQPGVDDLRGQAGELRELRRLAEALGLPVVGLLEAATGFVGRDGADPDHESLLPGEGIGVVPREGVGMVQPGTRARSGAGYSSCVRVLATTWSPRSGVTAPRRWSAPAATGIPAARSSRTGVSPRTAGAVESRSCSHRFVCGSVTTETPARERCSAARSCSARGRLPRLTTWLAVTGCGNPSSARPSRWVRVSTA